MGEKQIEIRHLSKYYGRKQALCDVSLTIGRGMFGLLGRNGAGKTTLMKTLATLLNKKSGEISICGIPVENAGEIRRITGYLPQEFSMYPGMTVFEAMDYLGILSELDDGIRKKRIPELLERVNLVENSRTKIKALSGGMKRRLGIAQALLHEPEVLIVDEPTAGLDPEERIRFRNLLCEVAGDRIVILSTHIAGDIEAACEKVAILDEGRLLYDGLVTELVRIADGKVFRFSATQKDLPSIKEKYLVTGVQTLGDRVNIRLIADEKPFPVAVPCEPGIEDAYMLYLHIYGNGKRKNGGERG